MTPDWCSRFVALFLMSASVAALPATAQTTDPLDPLYTCRNMKEDAERLACFDTAVSELFEKQQAGTVQAVDVATIEQIERESFGFSLPSLPALFSRRGSGGSTASAAASSAPESRSASAAITAPEGISEIVSPVRSIQVQRVTQRLTVTLENGQVWEQIDSPRSSVSPVRRASEARVRRAALGSFLMSLDGGVAFRVRRVS